MSKGTRRERQAVALLKRAGYATYRPATVQFGENDVWGLFDVLAIAPHLPQRAVQVKSNRALGVRDWTRHTRLWRQHGYRTEYWVPVDHQGWRVIRCEESPVDGGPRTREVYDGRDTQGMGDGLVAWLQQQELDA